MALSERERQMLEEMEEAIRAEDPRFASQMRGSRGGSGDRRRVAIGIIGAIAGLGLVILGTSTSIWIGVVGFALIVASVTLAVTPGKGGSAPLGIVEEDGSVAPASPKGRKRRVPGSTRGPGRNASKPPRAQRQGSFMERMEQRWEERRRQGQGW